jgi:hypothetical protein
MARGTVPERERLLISVVLIGGRLFLAFAQGEVIFALAQCRSMICAAFVLIEGVVQKDHGAINVVAKDVREV